MSFATLTYDQFMIPDGVRSASIVLLAMFLGVSSAVPRECVRVPPNEVLKVPDAELAFSGKVIEIINVNQPAGEVTRERPLVVRASFEVDRVWMGRVSKRFDVYMTYPSSSTAARYDPERSYVVIAKRLADKRARAAAAVGDSNTVLFTGVDCTDFYTVDEFVRALGPGKPPSEKSR